LGIKVFKIAPLRLNVRVGPYASVLSPSTKLRHEQQTQADASPCTCSNRPRLLNDQGELFFASP